MEVADPAGPGGTEASDTGSIPRTAEAGGLSPMECSPGAGEAPEAGGGLTDRPAADEPDPDPGWRSAQEAVEAAVAEAGAKTDAGAGEDAGGGLPGEAGPSGRTAAAAEAGPSGSAGVPGGAAASAEDAELLRQLKVKLSQGAAAVDHLQYLVTNLLASQARAAGRRAAGQEGDTLGAAERKALGDAHRKRVGDILGKQCLSVLKHLQNHKWAWPFNQPVDTQQFSDYLRVVQRPMDLGTIRRQSEAGHYRDPEQFAADMRLVFANAKTYNPPGSDVHVMASTLKARFEEKWQQSVVPKIADEMNTSRTEEAAALQRMREALRAKEVEAFQRSAAQLLKRIEALESIMSEYKSAAAALCRGMGREERCALQAALEALEGAGLEGAAALAAGQHPGLAAEGGALALDLDELDALTLQLLRRYARHAGPPPPPGAGEGGAAAEAEAAADWPGVLVASGIKRWAPPRSLRLARKALKAEESATAAAAAEGGAGGGGGAEGGEGAEGEGVVGADMKEQGEEAAEGAGAAAEEEAEEEEEGVRSGGFAAARAAAQSSNAISAMAGGSAPAAEAAEATPAAVGGEAEAAEGEGASKGGDNGAGEEAPLVPAPIRAPLHDSVSSAGLAPAAGDNMETEVPEAAAAAQPPPAG
eukprot:jgi/Tetstr1/432262/TSEL_002297.t1